MIRRPQPGFFMGVAGEGLNYSLVILIMVLLFVGRVVGPTVASVRRVPRSGGGPFLIVGNVVKVVRSLHPGQFIRKPGNSTGLSKTFRWHRPRRGSSLFMRRLTRSPQQSLCNPVNMEPLPLRTN